MLILTEAGFKPIITVDPILVTREDWPFKQYTLRKSERSTIHVNSHAESFVEIVGVILDTPESRKAFY